MSRTLVEKAKCLIINSYLLTLYWAEVYFIIRPPIRSFRYETPEEMYSSKHLNNLKILGCDAMIHLPKEKKEMGYESSKD